MRQNTEALRIGLIGCGRVAKEHHLPSLQRVANTEIVAVADVDYDQATFLAKTHKIATCYRHTQEMLADQRVEAVGILTPTPSHHQIGMAALQAGKHVFITDFRVGFNRHKC